MSDYRQQQEAEEQRERETLEALWIVNKVFPEEALFLAGEVGLTREFNQGLRRAA